jgi:hypothetical protein
MNTISEGAIPKFNETLKERDTFKKVVTYCDILPMQAHTNHQCDSLTFYVFIQRENIEKFISAGISVLECKKLDLFQVVDLFEKTNPGQVPCILIWNTQRISC